MKLYKTQEIVQYSGKTSEQVYFLKSQNIVLTNLIQDEIDTTGKVSVTKSHSMSLGRYGNCSIAT